MQRLVLRSFAAGRLLSGGCVFPVSGALDAQMEAHNYSGAAQDDPFQPSPARRAAVESLPATTLTKETAAAGQHTSCPICLHVRIHTLASACHLYRLDTVEFVVLTRSCC